MSEILPHAAGAFPLAAADQCVKCGMCLPHCPTYRVTLDEAQSPRGRIALMQGMATGALAASPQLLAHLDGCLTCRACEAVCPAHVPYGELIDAGRAWLADRRPRRAQAARLLAAVLARRPLRFAFALALWLYRRLGLQWLVRRGGLLGRGRLARLEASLPPVFLPRLPRPGAPVGTGSVALFAGCTSPLVEPETLAATVELLERLGCAVAVPRAQGCCGALYQHAGQPEPARKLAQRNAAAFAAADTIVGVATGCTAQLLDADAGLAAKVRDVHAFVAQHPALPALEFAPLAARVLLHTPCTLRNVVGGEGHVAALLARIPGLAVDTLEPGCCGAAGSYFLTQPAMADALVAPLVERARRLRPDFVLSSNVGCAMHLSAALRRAGVTAPVWHPVRLLARQARGSAPRAAAATAPPARPG